MTTGTATGPTVRSVARRARGPALLVLLLVTAGLLLAVVRGSGPSGDLDPDSYSPGGSRALRVLLEERGVRVVRLEGTSALAGAAVAGTTVLVTDPDALGDAQLADVAAARGQRVVLGGGDRVLQALELPAQSRGPVAEESRRPACDLPVAVVAGAVRIGGERWVSAAGGAEGCYAAQGASPLLNLPAQRVTLLGSGGPLTNERLGRSGAAALGLGLLGTEPTLLWVLPAPLEAAAEGPGQSLWSLYSDGVRTGALGLGLAVLVLALWRARQLGRVVPEPLPVVVRAAETVEGRGRLYRAARARGTAAESLRAGTRDRLVRRLGLPLDSGRESLVATVAARAGRDPGGVDRLLYGAAPVDDAALVRLADDLDSLIREAARS